MNVSSSDVFSAAALVEATVMAESIGYLRDRARLAGTHTAAARRIGREHVARLLCAGFETADLVRQYAPPPKSPVSVPHPSLGDPEPVVVLDLHG